MQEYLLLHFINSATGQEYTVIMFNTGNETDEEIDHFGKLGFTLDSVTEFESKSSILPIDTILRKK